MNVACLAKMGQVGGFDGKIIYEWRISIAMFDYLYGWERTMASMVE
jgi:hypothetical protein